MFHNKMNRKLLVITLILTGTVLAYSQSRGTPNVLRVRTDANNALIVASTAQVNPVTTSVFNNTRLATDSNGALLVVGAGGGEVNASDVTPGAFTGTDTTNFSMVQVGTDNPGDRVNFTGSLGSDSYHFVDGLSTDSTLRIYFNSTIQYQSSGSIRANHGLTDLFILFAGNGFNESDSISFRNATNSVTGSKAVGLTESNFTYITGDTDGQTFTLPNDPAVLGLFWKFIVTQTQASNSMSIAPNTGETLRDGTSDCSTLTATAIGSVVEIQVTATGSGGHFTVVDKLGTWTCNP